MVELDMLNKRYRGREVYHCNRWWNTINFNPTEITFCCNCTLRETPIMLQCRSGNPILFDKEYYIKQMIQLVETSQKKNEKSCFGCGCLQKAIYKDVFYEKVRIKNVIWNNFRGCNSKCIYCGDAGKKFELYYDARTIVEQLEKEEVFDKKVNVSFGGGEPTLVPNLEQYISFGIIRGWEQRLNTNALIYKEYITRALQNEHFSVQISVDSGTRDCYRCIKGQDGYEVVWNNIAKYCRTNGKVYIKYIVFSKNASKYELDSFIEKVQEVNAKRIVVSGESNSGWRIRKCGWKFETEEMEACAYLMDLIVRHNLAMYLSSGNFLLEDYNKILKIYTEKYLKGEIENRQVYIWGMGEYGKRLAKSLLENGVKITAFGDRDKGKWGTDYCNIECISLKNILKKASGERVEILIAMAEYAEAYSELIQHDTFNIRIINLQ